MRAIDLFSGAGGMSLGFENAGFQVEAAFDADQKHVETYAVNFPKTRVRKIEIQGLTKEKVLEIINPTKRIDLVFGGPPCQGFSVGGKGLIDDARNSLVIEFARIVSELRPKAFVAENVSGILSPKYKEVLTEFYSILRKAGYQIPDKPLVLNAEQYNVPQSRKRVFFIGVRGKLKSPPMPSAIYRNELSDLRVPKVKDAISDLPLLSELDYLFESDRYQGELSDPSHYAKELRKPRGGTSLTKTIGGFLRTRHTDDVVKRFSETPPGTREPISRFYRLNLDGLAPTLRAGTTPLYGQFMAPRPIHPSEPRCITVREAARLHSFPDWFEFYPTKWYGFMQVGNSVPPLMAEAVARALIEVMS